MTLVSELLEKYPELIEKIKHMSLQLKIEDLKDLSELFNVKSNHIMEIEELIAFQDTNKLELDNYRGAERFILTFIKKIYPNEDCLEINTVD